VVEVDRNPALHLEMLGRPWYRDNRVPTCADATRILDQFTRIFTTSVNPIARSRSVVHMLGLDRLPAELASIRRRIRRQYWKRNRNA
jgi:hypothetical protein